MGDANSAVVSRGRRKRDHSASVRSECTCPNRFARYERSVGLLMSEKTAPTVRARLKGDTTEQVVNLVQHRDRVLCGRSNNGPRARRACAIEHDKAEKVRGGVSRIA